MVYPPLPFPREMSLPQPEEMKPPRADMGVENNEPHHKIPLCQMDLDADMVEKNVSHVLRRWTRVLLTRLNTILALENGRKIWLTSTLV